MVARGWSKAQKEAYRLADNKLALPSNPGDRLPAPGHALQ
jgi:hypothetical protein